MVDLSTYEFKKLNTGEITPEYYFTNTRVEKLFELENVCNSTKWLCIILFAKYEMSYF